MRMLARRVARSKSQRTGSAVAGWGTSAPTVSVVLATRDGMEAVAARVANLLDCDYPADRLEVIVAIGAAGEVSAYDFGEARVRVVAAATAGGKWANLNTGVLAASGEVLVFADTAQRFERGTIAALVAPLEDPVVAGVTGWLALPPDVPAAVRMYWQLERALRRDEAALHSSIGVTGAVWALRRARWSPLPPGLILDDVYTPMRLVLEGARIAVSDQAIAHDTRAPQREAEYERKVRTLTGVYQVCAFLPGLLRPGRNPVWAQFVVHKLLRLATPFLMLLGGVAAALAAGVLLLRARIPLFVFGVAGVLLLAVVLLAVVLSPARRLVRAAWDALHLQLAALPAARNAWRGRWDVWR